MITGQDERQECFSGFFQPPEPTGAPRGRVLLPGDLGIESTLDVYPERVASRIQAYTPLTEATAYVEVECVLYPNTNGGPTRTSPGMAARTERFQRSRKLINDVCRTVAKPPVFRATNLIASVLVALPRMGPVGGEVPPRHGYYSYGTTPDRDNLEKTLWDPMEGFIFDDDCRLTDGPFGKHHANDDYPACVKVWFCPDVI